MVLEETGALHAAAEATLQAAWVADDLDRPDLARRLAAGGGGAVARRARRSTPSRPCAWSMRCAGRRPGTTPPRPPRILADSRPPEAVAQVIALEQRLIEAGDAGRHTVATALPPPSRRPHVSHQKIAARGEGLWAKLRRLFGKG